MIWMSSSAMELFHRHDNWASRQGRDLKRFQMSAILAVDAVLGNVSVVHVASQAVFTVRRERLGCSVVAAAVYRTQSRATSTPRTWQSKCTT